MKTPEKKMIALVQPTRRLSKNGPYTVAKMLMACVMVLVFCFTGCSKEQNNTGKTFVLVHGAWQSAYVWSDVKAELEKKGNKVVVVDLPAHGADQTPASSVSIINYRDKIISMIEKLTGKVILVGHSMGGVVVSAVAEQIPERIEKLVFIGAFVPQNGQSLLDLAFQDKSSLLGPNLIPSSDQLTLDVNKAKLTDIFCQDATETMKKLVITNYKPEPAIPFGDKIKLTSTAFGAVAKYYVFTGKDQAISLELQKQMANAAGITNTYTVDTGHSPFLSMPERVSEIFIEISR
ncbi:alpha/beta fold hydrolase [Pedobacter psychrodurus]|uniref:alpha/beta fold hydrolase n=1 Tax=Pedobacter psychrodurus TaxID=2530456 RepID=UPI0029318C65|nr:alpha/beta fold hydrolase [Pedobacter psychrodurus]